jgi:hypothetical protein
VASRVERDQRTDYLYRKEIRTTEEEGVTASLTNHGATLIAPRLKEPTIPIPIPPPSDREAFSMPPSALTAFGKRDNYSLSGKIAVVNLMNKIALYNFLSSFSGTHFVTSRTVQVEVTLHF